jgi:cell division protein FtsB
MKDLFLFASILGFAVSGLGLTGYYRDNVQLKAENHQLQAKVSELETTIKGMLINK